MQIVPVLDLLGGEVVRGVAGRRSEYRPIQSLLSSTPKPLDIARAFRSHLGLTTLYLADLDAILHGQPNWETYGALSADGFRLWIDAGLQTIESARQIFARGADSLIAGLESWPDPEWLGAVCREFENDRIMFSLDLKSGQPLGHLVKWPSCDPVEIAERAIAAGAGRLIVLDLSHVGVGGGPGTLELCRQFRQSFPVRELITGGGVRNGDDLTALARTGIDAVLVASALHDRRVTRSDLDRVSTESP